MSGKGSRTKPQVKSHSSLGAPVGDAARPDFSRRGDGRRALGEGRRVRYVLAPGALESYGEIFREELGLPRNFFGRSTLSHPTARLFLHALELKERGYELGYGLELASLLEFTRGKFARVPADAMRAGVRRGLGDWGKDPALAEFAATLEDVVITSVEAGHMTKDLALLVGPDQKWETTEEFLDTLDKNLAARLA